MKKVKQILGMTTAGIAGGFIAVLLFQFTAFDPYPVQDQSQEANQAVLTYDTEEVRNYGNSAPTKTKLKPFTGPDFVSAAENTVNGVVHVKTLVEGKEYYEINPLHFFFGTPERTPRRGPDRSASGSGVVISQDGYIVTNNHVIKEAKEIEVITNDNRSFEAEIVGRDPSTDVALLKVDAENLSTISYGNSDEVKPGEWVLAVGNPLNLNSTVTAGIISAKGRNINILASESREGAAPIESFIQTDAAVNPGNSGGALVNSEGELIGINTAIKSPTGVFAGYSFAIPSNIVKKVVADLKEYGVVQRAYIGVSIRDIDSKLAEEEGLSRSRGVFVAETTENGAARDAGLQEGDVIVSVDGVEVNTVSELQERIGRHRPGDEVPLEYVRKGKSKQVDLVLRNKMGNTKIVKREHIDSKKLLGAQFKEPDESLMRRLRIRNGVQIKDVGDGKFQEAGVKNGFIILSVDKKEVENFEDFYTMINSKSGGVLIEGVYPNGIRGYYGVGL